MMNMLAMVNYISGNALNAGIIFEQHLYPTKFFKQSEYVPRCLHCYPKYRSSGELELAEFCKRYYPDLKENDRTLIKPYELDIVIPEKKLAIEFNR